MEGAVCKKEDELVSLSEPNLVECCSSCANSVYSSFEYTRDNGINTDEDYPRIDGDYSCKFDGSKRVVKISGYGKVKEMDEEDLTDKIATEGPTSVAIDAGHISFQLYSSGIYYEPHCSSTRLDHFVLAVGYGVVEDAEYYIVKNSWGTTWGENGYIKMSRNRNNNCGIATRALWAIA